MTALLPLPQVGFVRGRLSTMYGRIMWHSRDKKVRETEKTNHAGSSGFEVIRKTNILLCIAFRLRSRTYLYHLIHISAEIQKSHHA
jgi:hypothetical protein